LQRICTALGFRDEQSVLTVLAKQPVNVRFRKTRACRHALPSDGCNDVDI
jgi:hypothetical protein